MTDLRAKLLIPAKKNRTAYLLLALLLMTMIATMMMFWRQSKANADDRASVTHTYEVIENIELLFNKLMDAEFAERGFVITGKEEYLKAYNDAHTDSIDSDAEQRSIAQQLRFIKEMTTDNPVHLRSMDEMENLITMKLNDMKENIQLRKTHGINAFRSEITNLRGKQMIDQIRDNKNELVAEEHRLLALRTKIDQANVWRFNLLIFTCMMMFYAMLVYSLILLVRYRRQVKKFAIETSHYTKALERSNEELDAFAYAAAHDLKAPLRVVDNASQWLEEDLQKYLTDEIREHMKLLRGRVKRMMRLLDDLLEYSRIGKIWNEKYSEIITGMALMDNILALLSPPIGFAVKVSPNFARIHVCRMPLQQILMNLINNAIKHHDKKTGSIEVTVEDTGATYTFSVKDDGPGIPAQFHGQIFKMFKTLKRKDQVEGSGMGLAMVKKNVEFYGGTLHLESAVGQGSVFSFTWPKQQSKGNAK